MSTTTTVKSWGLTMTLSDSVPHQTPVIALENTDTSTIQHGHDAELQDGWGSDDNYLDDQQQTQYVESSGWNDSSSDEADDNEDDGSVFDNDEDVDTDASSYWGDDANKDEMPQMWGTGCGSDSVNDNTVLPQTLDWAEQSIKDDLEAQERCSSSLIARRLAKLGVVVGIAVEDQLALLEEKTSRTMMARAALWNKRRRHERSILVDTREKLQPVLDRLAQMDHSDVANPKVVIDCEGLNFKRTGTIDIMELFIRPDDTLYLIDIATLKNVAWTATATDTSLCLRGFLSSPSCKKIMWDLRMDAHILHKLYGIRLAGILDSSLWSVAYRRKFCRGNDSFRLSIEAGCHDNLRHLICEGEMESLAAAKDARSRLPPRPWTIRPLPEVLIDYAADVKYIGMLYDVYYKKLRGDDECLDDIEYYTEQELEIACDPFWPAFADKSADSPWTYGYLESIKRVNQSRRQDAAEQTQLGARLRRFGAEMRTMVWQLSRQCRLFGLASDQFFRFWVSTAKDELQESNSSLNISPV